METHDVARTVATLAGCCKGFGPIAVQWQSGKEIERRHTVRPAGHNDCASAVRTRTGCFTLRCMVLRVRTGCMRLLGRPAEKHVVTVLR